MKRSLSLLSAALVSSALLSSAWIGAAHAAKKKPVAPVVVEAPVPPAPPPDPDAWRASAPAPGADRPWAPPEPKTFTLSNGIPVYLAENPALPLVTTSLILRLGRETNPAGKAGLAALTATLLDEGTRTRTGAQIAGEAALLGADLSVYQGDEMAWVALDALTGAPLAGSLDLMADVALHPKFDAREFARVKTETLTAIQSQKAEPRDVVTRAFASQLYGDAHPYGTPSIGSEASVSGLSIGDAKKFYKTWWHAGNAAIVVAGAVTQAKIQPLLEARFGTWAVGKATRPTVAPAAAPLRTRVVFVAQPGAVQSVIRVGTVGVARPSPEFMAANVAGTVLAGMFSSPVNMKLREELGWSYGAYGGFSDSRVHGTFAIRTSVQADKTAPAVAELVKELLRAAGTPPTEASLELSKNYLKKSLPGNFETNSGTAGSFAWVPGFGLPADMWRAYPAEVDAVGVAQAHAAAARYFDPARQLVIVAGPRTFEVPGEGGATTSVDVVQELTALGYEFVELSAPAP